MTESGRVGGTEGGRDEGRVENGWRDIQEEWS